MKLRFRIPLLAMAGFLFATVAAYSADQYTTGSRVAAFSANDQFGAPFKLALDNRALLISFDMGTSKIANQKLSALGKDFLPKHQAVFVADTHGMPAIGRTFALPKMRSYAHRIVLADSESLLTPFPRRDKLVTVLLLQNGKVTGIRYWNPETEDVAKLLGAP